MATPPPRVNPSSILDTYLYSWLPSWKPTSEDQLVEAEKNLETSFHEYFVPVGPDAYIHTIVFEADQPAAPSVDEEPRVPLVMIHGFGCGIPQFYKNFDHLHSHRKLYAIDLPGFARSTRVEFTPDAEQCEQEFVDYIEKWREGVGLEKFILLGHSLGAFLSCAYTMCHPNRVRHLILDDPWGFPVKPTDHESEGNRSSVRRRPFFYKAAFHFTKIFNPLAPIRAAGPLGPYLISRYRPDLATTFNPEFMDYVYHSNAQSPTGETAFFHMQIPLAWAKRPMLERINTEMDPSVPISFIYGSHSWMSSTSGTKASELRFNSYVKIYKIPAAGHHVHADQPEAFNLAVNAVLHIVDKNEDAVDVDQNSMITETVETGSTELFQ